MYTLASPVFVEDKKRMLELDGDGIDIKDPVALDGFILRMYVIAPQSPAAESVTAKEIKAVAPLPII